MSLNLHESSGAGEYWENHLSGSSILSKYDPYVILDVFINSFFLDVMLAADCSFLFRLLSVRLDAACVDLEQSSVSLPQRLDQVGIRPIGHIDQADIVILSIETPGRGLVHPLEPVSSDQFGHGECLLYVIAVCPASFRLVFHLNQAGRQAAARGSEMEFADQNRLAGQLRNAVDPIGIDFIVVNIDTVHIECPGGPDLRVGRTASTPHSQVEMVRIVFPDGGTGDLYISVEGLVDESPSPFACLLQTARLQVPCEWRSRDPRGSDRLSAAPFAERGVRWPGSTPGARDPPFLQRTAARPAHPTSSRTPPSRHPAIPGNSPRFASRPEG